MGRRRSDANTNAATVSNRYTCADSCAGSDAYAETESNTDTSSNSGSNSGSDACASSGRRRIGSDPTRCRGKQFVEIDH